MTEPRTGRPPEHPPSPSAPTSARSRRGRVAASAAVIGLAVATTLGPAAAAPRSSVAARTAAAREAALAEDTPVVDAHLEAAAEAKQQAENEMAWALALARQQRGAFFQKLSDQAAQAAAAEAAAAKEAAAEAADQAAAEEAAAEAAVVAAAEDAAAEEAARHAAEDAAAAAAEDAAAEEAAAAAEEAAEEPHRQQDVAPEAPAAPSGGVWDSLAQCESGGNWSTNTGNGYYGGLQFSLSTWQGHGGSGLPNESSREAQIAVAERVRSSQGWGAWPACSNQLGLS